MGEPLDAIRGKDPLGGGSYMVLQPPILPHDFKGIVVTGFPDIGVCRIGSISNDFVGDSSGSQVRLAVDNLAKQLAAKYGAYSSKVDSCSDPSGCNVGWLASLQDKKADYHYSWRLGDQQRPDHLFGIVLKAYATDAFTSQVRLIYFSVYEQACENEENAASGQGL